MKWREFIKLIYKNSIDLWISLAVKT